MTGMYVKAFLSQKIAIQIAEGAEADAIKRGVKVSIAMVDEAGQLIFFTKTDQHTNAAGDRALTDFLTAVIFLI